MKENWWKAAGPMEAAQMDKKFYRKEEASRGCTPGAAQPFYYTLRSKQVSRG